MVFFKGANLIGPDNRDERGAYEQVEKRIHRYMQMEDDEWGELYKKMYHDRKYPGRDSLKMMIIPSIFYVGVASTFSFEFYIKRSTFFSSPYNYIKLGFIPVFTLLALRNSDIAWDIVRYRRKYPEMYQPNNY